MNAIEKEPFSSSVVRSLTSLVATTSKICTNGTSTHVHTLRFGGTITFAYTLRYNLVAAKGESRLDA